MNFRTLEILFLKTAGISNKTTGYVMNIKSHKTGNKTVFLTMKLTVFLLTVCFLQVNAKGVGQNINFSGKDVLLEKVFNAIEQQTDYVVFYNYNALQKASLINIDAQNMPLKQFLDQCLQGQPLTYEIIQKTVVIKEKEDTLNSSNKPSPSNIIIHGRIINEKGEPVPGASVMIKGTRIGTSADGSGTFVLNVPDSNKVLVISGVNIETTEVKLNGRTDITIIVKTKTNPLDELQVIAYGTTTKRFNVGSVSTVKAEEIEKQPVDNVMLALEGRVPGLIITPESGAPGATVKVQIRGQNTLTTNVISGHVPYDQPLIIIDGVPFAPQNNSINIIQSAGSGAIDPAYPYGFGALSNINPLDIESITVLRDADATSIYGSQGANGVILITTKKGKPGKTSFSLNINTGPNKITRQVQFLNTQQYLEMRHEALNNDGIVLPPAYDGNYPDLQLFDTTKYTDWFHQFYGGTSNNTDVHGSLTGGTDNMSFILSAGYNHATYNFPGDFADNRISFHSGFHYKSKNDKLTADFGTDYSYAHNNNSASPQATAINELPPDLPDLIDPSGNLVWNYKGLDLGGVSAGQSYFVYQQYAYLKQPYDLGKYNLGNSLQLNYKLLPDLTATINLGYSRFTTKETSKFPKSSMSPSSPYSVGTANFGENEFETINIEPQVSYRHNFAKGIFTALVGATYKINNSHNQEITGTNYTNDAFLGSITAAGYIAGAFSNDLLYKYIGVYGRVNYIYNSRYIINITGRRDGSTNFGPGKQYGNFGSVGAGWIISEERFLKARQKLLSLLKLSANYGTNGSDGVAPYNYQAYWSVPDPLLTAPFQNTRPYQPVNLYNPDYSWALKKTLNISLDIGLLQDNVLLNATWYRSVTGNQLVGALLPSQTGFTSVISNLDATLEDKGFEFTLSSTNIKTKHFTWTSNFNISFNRNKLLKFPDLDNSPYSYIYTVGKSISTVYGFRYKDVNPQTGLFEFYDAKGNITSTPNYARVEDGGDIQEITDLQPKFTGGLGNIVSYKNLSLTVFFQFVKQTAPNYLSGIYNTGSIPGTPYNFPVQVLDRWQKTGDITPIEKFTAGYSPDVLAANRYFAQSSGLFSDASYIRLKTASLSYTLNSGFIRKAKMESMTVYVNAQNLLTFTGYKVGDPEMPGQLYSIPLQRTIAFGLSFNF